MKLAEPITNSSGVTLMPAGIRLTPMFIARIKKWNIEALDVIVEKKKDIVVAAAADEVAGAKPRKDTKTPETLSAAQEEFARAIVREVSAPFINVRDNEIMMLLRASVIKRLIQHGRKGIVNQLRRPPGAPEEVPAEEQ